MHFHNGDGFSHACVASIDLSTMIMFLLCQAVDVQQRDGK